MKKVKLDGAVTSAEVKKGIELQVAKGFSAYSLRMMDRTGNRLVIVYLKDKAKKLSTINKYAEKYGVEFVK